MRCLYRGKVKTQVDAHHIVGHDCMTIDSLWNLRHRVEVEVGEWGSSSNLEWSLRFSIVIRDL